MRKAKPRFSREDWIELGLALLAEQGPEALTIERLTERAAKTRGSFYHHFIDHQAFLTALGDHWLERDEAIYDAANAALLTGERRETLARKTADLDHALERSLRRLAAGEPAIAEAVARSDERRIAYLVRLFRGELGLDSAEALARARVQHAFFVGAQMVFPEADARFRLKLQKALGATLWRK